MNTNYDANYIIMCTVPIVRNIDWHFVILSDDIGFLMGKGVDKDISASIQLTERESELVDFFQKAPIALHWLSGTGHIIWANDTEINSLGYSPDEYIGHSIIEASDNSYEGILECHDLFLVNHGSIISLRSFVCVLVLSRGRRLVGGSVRALECR